MSRYVDPEVLDPNLVDYLKGKIRKEAANSEVLNVARLAREVSHGRMRHMYGKKWTELIIAAIADEIGVPRLRRRHNQRKSPGVFRDTPATPKPQAVPAQETQWVSTITVGQGVSE